MNMNKEKENLQALRHSTEHVLTQAMINLYGKKLQMAMGPAIDDGFYFDFDYPEKISVADFPKIEKEMQKIIDADLPIKKDEITVAKAREMFSDNPYKQEWIDEIETKDEKISIYWTGDQFVDLCSGPHLKSTGQIKVFKLLSVAGAYWHGDEKNKMLVRIYGTAFETKKELNQYLELQKEAKKRDHRVLGPQLDLFVIHKDIGKGLPLLTPKGTIIKNEILKYERLLGKKADFQEVSTPHIAKNDLYKRTGHWQHYREVMYSPFGIDNETYVLKPMNCPHHYMIYSSKPRSYKDLPIRLSEPGTCYRYEKSGELGGLTRVRALTIDDSHILMQENQIEKEFSTSINMVKAMFKAFGLTDYQVRLSLNDPDDNLKYIADADIWKKAGQKLKKIVKDNRLDYQIVSGEASFYGPKIDFMVKDAIGREWQMSTLQLDLFMAKRLDLTYTDKNGQKKNPVILHQGLTGSIERTIGILIEHYAGNFPTWLTPIQVRVLSIAAKHLKYAKTVVDKLKQADIRVELDDKNNTIQDKIRQGHQDKVAYMLIIGDKEVKDKTVSERARNGKPNGPFTVETFITNITKEIEEKTIN